MLLGKVDEDEEFLTVDRFQVTGSHLSRDYVLVHRLEIGLE